MSDYNTLITRQLDNCLTTTNLPRGVKSAGKVRDRYVVNGQVILACTDRLSAFDRLLAVIPCKGQVLNQTSGWWFEQTRSIIPNHVVAHPDPNITIAKNCTVFPIEFVVRGYITGSTETSLWTHYQSGVRSYCGHTLPEGLVKNQQLEQALVTPTTKAADHDRLITPVEILAEGWMTPENWEFCRQKALELFARGQNLATRHGLILVDTKYEFGRDADGRILLVDEIHTPDSSRYWIASSYREHFAQGQEPEYVDKEFLRLWFKANCDPYRDATLPPAPRELVIELSRRYIRLYEMITGQTFAFPPENQSISDRIRANLDRYFDTRHQP